MAQEVSEVYTNATLVLTNALQTLYTASAVANTYAIMHTLIISNKEVSDIEITVVLTKAAVDYVIVPGVTVYPNESFSMEKPMNLRNGDQIKVSTTGTSADAVASILELTVTI